MITIFNRKLIECTLSMERQSHIREQLSRNKIKYILKMEHYMYYFYVHKKEYDLAKAILDGTYKR